MLLICTFYQLRSLQHAASGYTKRVQMRTKQLCAAATRLGWVLSYEITGPAQGEGLWEPGPPNTFWKKKEIKLNTVEPRYNEGPRDWQNIFVITRFVNLYQGVFFTLPYMTHNWRAPNVSGFIAQLVEHRTGNREVTGSNLVEVLNFFQSSLRNCINCVHCDDHFYIFIFRNIHYVHINSIFVGIRIFQHLYLSLSVSIPVFTKLHLVLDFCVFKQQGCSRLLATVGMESFFIKVLD